MRFRTGRGRSFVPFVAFIAVLLAAACGAPEYTYVTNSDDRTYVRIPTSWQAVDEAELATALGLDPTVSTADQGVWIEAYDAATSPSAAHLLGPHAEAPNALVFVQDVPPQMRGQYSLDRLRDLFQPVSPTARQQAGADPNSLLTNFGLMADEVVTPVDGIRGIHVIYQYRVSGGPYQVFDKTAFVNDDASKLYVFVARCSSQCYGQRQEEIDRVVSSFTVLEGS
jgi:hypothetical protein